MHSAPLIAFTFVKLLSVVYAIRLSPLPGQAIGEVSDPLRNDNSAVPGDSPVIFHNDPSNNVFKIQSLDMIPNPCVIESYCKVSIEGEFVSSLLNTTPHLSFNVTTHFDDGRTGLVPGEDDFCSWADVFQDDDEDSASPDFPLMLSNRGPIEPSVSIVDALRQMRKTCPPRQGRATINATILLLGGYVPEANYSVAVNVTIDGGRRTIFDLWAEFPLKYRDGAGVREEDTNAIGVLDDLKPK
ncbi:MAG: hypothetical protein M1814_003471 [Vezdaea aestivalis]|nr:MAG: hypothetical protein M1814_003471 [Vezdaea aestivalis]